MKKILSLFICYLAVNVSFAQQDKQFTHYNFDRMSFNPAATGFKGYCGTLIYRNQWDRVQDAPNTTLFNAQGNFPKQNLGLGLSFTNDAIGFQRNNTVTLNAAYHVPPTPYGVLSVGLGLGIVNVGFSPNWIPPQTMNDANLPTNTSGTGFDANFGLYWHGAGNKYYVGLSMTHLTGGTLSMDGDPLFGGSLNSVSYSVARHYYVLGGYDFDLTAVTGLNTQIDLKPSILIKSDGSTSVFDFNLLADVYLSTSAYFWGGLSYRMSDAIAVMAGFAFAPNNEPSKNWAKIGYSFDIMTNPLNAYGKGTHELMLNYCMFPPPPVVPRHGNPFILQ